VQNVLIDTNFDKFLIEITYTKDPKIADQCNRVPYTIRQVTESCYEALEQLI